jgi:hypothetical protein
MSELFQLAGAMIGFYIGIAFLCAILAVTYEFFVDTFWLIKNKIINRKK